MTIPEHLRGTRDDAATTGTGATCDDDAWSVLDDAEVGYDPDPLVPDGDYSARVVTVDVRQVFKGGRRVFITFELRDGPTHPGGKLTELHCGEHDGKRVRFIATLPVPAKGSRRRLAGLQIAPASRYYRAWVVANGGQAPRRRDRLSLHVFRHRIFRIRTRTVVKDNRQKDLPLAVRYSVVDVLVERMA
jgi:hypothetical protein